MSTQDDPENLPWQNSRVELRGVVLHPPKPNSPIQFYYGSVIPSVWLSEATVALKGTSTSSAAGALTAQLGNRGTTIITPPAGSMNIGPQPLKVKVSDDITVTDRTGTLVGNHEDSPIPAGPEESVPNSESCNPTHQSVDWVEQLSRGIPKHLREEIFGDLCEVRAKMAAEGCSPLEIKRKTFSQLLLSILYGLCVRLGWIIMIYNRVSDWLSPNK